ncbi:MAG: dihydrolipoyl dehydrogenase [Rhabdochlamydiaceae bacterium]
MINGQKFDIVIIGGGPGGYVAAIKASQQNKTVCLIEKKHLGGTCLNVGCIPTKTLVANAEVLEKVKTASSFGIYISSFSVDFARMIERKNEVVNKIRRSLEGLLQSNGLTIIKGEAEFLSPYEIKIKGEESGVIQASKVIIATGSEPLNIPNLPCDHQRVFNSSSILDLKTLPQSIAIIGGGYIGCEFASLYASLGVKVTVLEAMPGLVLAQGQLISEALTKAFQKQGIDVRTSVFVEGIDQKEDKAVIRLKDGSSLSADIVLVAVGRKLCSYGLGLDKAGLKADEKGAIKVNSKMETKVPGIYAIGDVTGECLLAHVASHQGIVAALNAVGQESHMHYEAIPAVIFTHPEIAMVGLTLEQALEKGHDAIVGKFPFQALGKSVASMETDGFSQIIIDKKTKAILGAQVVGAHASHLIAEITLAIANELTVESLIETVHAHPTVSESWLEAALIAEGTPIHFPPKLKKGS